jgi:hypothetical protein
MFPTKKTFVKQNKIKVKCVRILCFLIAAFCVAGSFLITRITFSANDGIFPKKIVVAPAPETTPTSQIPPPKQAERIKITIGEPQDIPFAAGINSAAVVSTEIAVAQIKSGRVLTITGLKVGETILIVFDSQKRLTFIVEVTGKRAVSERRNAVIAERAENEKSKISGSYNATYVQGFNRNPSLLRQNIEFQRKLSKQQTLRISGEMFKLFDNNVRNQAFAKVQNFGLNRLSVRIDSPDKTIDFLDSEIKISPLSFNNFAMRGFRLATSPKSNNEFSKGIEIFAGLARPSITFFDDRQGKFAGAMLPVAGGRTWQARAGFIIVIPQKNNRYGRSSNILQFSGVYVPNKNFSADGEITYSGGELSWRARVDLRFRQFGASGEIIRFDRNSPLNSIGAQPGGRKSEALAFSWRPERRFNISLTYNHIEITRLTNLRLADFNRSTFSANASYRINQNSRLNLRFLDQQFETAVPGGASKFQIGTRAFTIGHNIRFNQNWTNNFEARINFSREAAASTRLENGFNLHEQLRFSRQKTFVTGFFNYTYKTPSLTNLIVRNPQILPPLLQEAFILDPQQFLQIYRDRLAFLLNGIELPQTRSLDAGFRFQTTVSRFTLMGETRYNAGEILSQNQKNLFTFAGLNVRLDDANSFQINGWKSFGIGGQTAVTFSYTHRFGTGSESGFQFSDLFGFDKGRVQGRVFYDLNGNGQDDKGEPGIAGMTVQLNEKRSVKTDAGGRYQFSANEGGYTIALISGDLGVRLRASTAMQQQISLYSRQTSTISFGVSDFGFVSGRVFNDVNLTGETPKSDLQGLKGVRVILRSGNIDLEQTTNAGGTYEFYNLRPGKYTLVIDSVSLPANFRLPAQTVWEVRVEPLQGFYFDIPIAAQRAVAGFVFIDKNRDGEFNPQVDEPVEGAYVTANDNVAVSDADGAYIIRNLAAGKVKLTVRSPHVPEGLPIFLELGAEPSTKRAVNIALIK